MSRVLPNAMVAQAFLNLGIRNEFLEADLPPMVDLGLQKLYGFQHNDGGWGWWYDDETDVNQTAYVLFGLAMTERAGFVVDEGVMQRGTEALNQLMPEADPRAQAYSAYVLTMAGQPISVTVALSDALALDLFSQAALAIALDAAGDAELSASLVDNLREAVVQDATTAHWVEHEDHAAYSRKVMGSTVRTTAMVTNALTHLDPESPLLPKAVRWLMSQRQGQGWGDTQKTSYAILALTDYLLATGELAAGAGYQVYVNGELWEEGQLDQGDVGQTLTMTYTAGSLLGEALAPGEGFTLSMPITTSEAVTVSETLTASEAITTGEALTSGEAITVGQTITTGEAITVGVPITASEEVTVSQGITVEETITVTPSITSSEALTVSESITVGQAITTEETITVTPSITTSEALTVSEGITVGQAITTEETITVTPSITTSEALTVSQGITVGEAITTEETITVTPSITTSEGVTVSQAVTVGQEITTVQAITVAGVISPSLLQPGENLIEIVLIPPEGGVAGRLYYALTLHAARAPGEEMAAASQSSERSIDVQREYRLQGSREPATPPEFQAGDLVEVHLTLDVPEESWYVIVDDPLPAGFEALNERLGTTSHVATAYEEPVYHWRDNGYNRKDVRDERVTLFITHLDPGQQTLSYLARAITAGEFAALPTEVYAMYEPEVWSRSDGASVRVWVR